MKKLTTQIFTFFVLFASTHAAAQNNTIRIIEADLTKVEDDYDYALNNDNWEGYNRAVFNFNKTIDDYFLAPVARGYGNIMPQWGKERVRDFYNNLQEPRNFVNSLTQGDVEGTFRAFWRAIINSTFGIAGLHDFAGGFGLKEKDKFFSQTLAFYGVPAGEFIVLPLFGSSTYRDFLGLVADNATDPDTYISGDSEISKILMGSANFGEVVSIREGLLPITDDLEATAFDLYSSYKSGYLQNRKKQVEETLE